MRIKSVIACSAAIAVLASAQGVLAQNKPAAPVAPAATINAPAIAEQADRLIKEMSGYIGSANDSGSSVLYEVVANPA